MKKLSFLLAIVAITGIGVVIINACSKSESGITNNVGYQPGEFIPDKSEVIPLIKSFNENYQAHKQNLKSGGDMPLNEALWMLEAGVNYEFRSAKDSLTNIIYYSKLVTTGLITGENGDLIIPGNDLMEAYDALLEFTSGYLMPGEDEKKLLLADVTLDDAGSGEATFALTTGIGIVLPRRCEVKNDDYWYGASAFGQCGDYQGQNIEQDASSRINELLNAKHCSVFACANGGSVFYTSIDSLIIIEGTGANEWAFWSGDAMDCLTPADISYWWDVAEDVIEENRPQGKVFVNVDYTWDYFYADEIYMHKADPVRYGILNCSGGNED